LFVLTGVLADSPASSRTRALSGLPSCPTHSNGSKGASVSNGNSRPALAFFSASTTPDFFIGPLPLAWRGRPSGRCRRAPLPSLRKPDGQAGAGVPLKPAALEQPPACQHVDGA